MKGCEYGPWSWKRIEHSSSFVHNMVSFEATKMTHPILTSLMEWDSGCTNVRLHKCPVTHISLDPIGPLETNLWSFCCRWQTFIKISYYLDKSFQSGRVFVWLTGAYLMAPPLPSVTRLSWKGAKALTRKSHWRGRLSTVNLVLLNGSFFNLIFLGQITYLNVLVLPLI